MMPGGNADVRLVVSDNEQGRRMAEDVAAALASAGFSCSEPRKSKRRDGKTAAWYFDVGNQGGLGKRRSADISDF